MRLLSLLALSVLLFGSCVTNKKLVLLKKMNDSESGKKVYQIDTFNYKLQPNDIVSIRFQSLTSREFDFLNTPAFDNNAISVAQANPLLIGEIIDETGHLTYPVIGRVFVAGLTVFQLQQKMEVLAGNYFQSPIVKVRLLNYRATVLGEVNREGSVIFNNNRVTILEAIGSVGGFTDFADRANVKLIRQNGGKVEVTTLNFLDENIINSPNWYVHQNDVLIVRPLPVRPYVKYANANLTLLISALTLVLLTINLTR
jgi:polysaccharide export outer membrane protein